MSEPLKSPSTGGVKISNVQLVNLPSDHGTYSVEISGNSVKRKLQEKRVDGDRVVWSESLAFTSDFADQSFFHFKIVRTRLGMKKTVGSLKEKVMGLFRLQNDSGSCKFSFFKGCQLEFTIEQQHDILSDLMNETDATPTGTSTYPGEIANIVMKAHDTFIDQEDIWTPFLSHFEAFMKAIDTISEVHPYVKMAWGVLSVIPKTIISQGNRNDNINKLIQRLKDIYDYITDANRLSSLKETQSKALAVLVQQTIECAYFLREYGELHTGESFLFTSPLSNTEIISAKRILTGISIDGKISDFNEKFDHILNVMTNSVALETNIVTLRISDDISGLRKDVGETKDLTLLGELPYAQNAGFLSTKRCLPGTREKLITEILDWTNGNGVQRLLLLLGQAGTGKSSVAQTISQIFDKQNRLGALFCFSRSYKDRRNLLFSTISRQLADGDIQWRESLIPIIQKTSIRTSLDVLTQFNELIVKPSENLNTIGPVVIVIDGLDESGDRKEREELLEILFKRCSELPPNYRFVVTSRPESDIEEWSKHPTVLYKHMTDINSNETASDIQQYISFRLHRAEDALNEALGVDWRSLLAERAEGLFQWASTVCDFINPGVEFGLARRAKFISRSTSSLYQLYHQIFTSQQEFNEPEYLPAFKTIMGALITAREPLSIRTLQSLFHDDICDGVKSIMQPFHSLFLGIHDLDTPIRPLHTSLTDFLTTRFIDIVDDKHDIKTTTKVENQFYIAASDQGYFALACLKLMNSGKTGLRFNICNLETSHELNQYVPDLDHRIQATIPSHLSYACYFWAIHLKHSDLTEDLLKQLHFLMNVNLLYLFEALGLSREIEQVCISMNILAEWCRGVDGDLANQAEDASQFGYDFGYVIMASTPHLYLSALPLARKHSFIRKQFLDSFPHCFSIEPGQSLDDSNRNLHVLKRNTCSTPSAIAFSPGGKYIATGFQSGEFWLWDYKTGEIVYQWGPQKSAIQSIVFSPNGESATACFKDASIKIWNIEKGVLVYWPNEEVPGHLVEYSTISSDGRYFVLHKWGTVLLYSISSCSELEQLVCFHIRSESKDDEGYYSLLRADSIFSSNGELLAFQNGFDTISFWCTSTQKAIGSLHLCENIYTMAFFPNGTHIGTVNYRNGEIWDVLTRTKIYHIECNQWTIPICLKISPDSQNLFCLFDRATHVWNISKEDWIQNIPHESHACSLAISPDCRHVAVATEDGEIQVQKWEITSRTADVSGELSYTKAQLSPRSRYLILEGTKLGDAYIQILDMIKQNETAIETQIIASIIEISPGDEYIAYITTRGLCLWSGEREIVLDASNANLTALAFSFTGDHLLSGDQSGDLIIWNTHTCQPRKLMSRHQAWITALAFSISGAQFLVVNVSEPDLTGDHFIEIYDNRSGELLKGPFTYKLDMEMVHWEDRCFVAFSANESRIIYLTPNDGLILDAGTGQILHTFTSNRKYFTLSLNRKYIIWGKKREIGRRLWDIDEGVGIEGQWNHCYADAVAFSNNSREVITIRGTGGINFFDISTGTGITMPTFHHCSHLSDLGTFRTTSISSNEKYLVLVVGGSFKVWSLEAMLRVREHQSKIEPSEETVHTNQDSSGLDEKDRKAYALVAWKRALFSDSSEIHEDGWVLGPNGEILFWVPAERRTGLWRPNMVHGAGPRPITKLNFSNFVHGSTWTDFLCMGAAALV